MPPLAQIPLESYLLAQQAAPIDCLVCKQENCRSATRCRWCRAPMALAHQAESVKHAPRIIAVLGATGSGKTTYLGMLMDILTRQVGLPRTTARGPLSIALQQTTATALSTGWFPEKTDHNPEHWHWVHCQFHCRRRRQPLEVVFADVAGSAFAEETEHEGRYPAIRALLANSAGILVLADAERLKAGDHEHDFVTLKLLTLLGDLREEQTRSNRLRWSERRPLALVLTKADKCDGYIEDPREFAEAHAGTLIGSAQTRFPRNQVFACSVAGATAHRDLYGTQQPVPLRIEPHGIVEPFGWLVTEMK
jgi:energy-coupling factor transporter ATP-binding protein EcfA2